MSRIINSILDDIDVESASESDYMMHHATASYEEPAAEALLPPKTQVEINGRVKMHRKHRKITARGLRAAHKTGVLKELKKSNETMTQKIKKMEKKIRNMERCEKTHHTSIKGKASHIPNGVRVNLEL